LGDQQLPLFHSHLKASLLVFVGFLSPFRFLNFQIPAISTKLLPFSAFFLLHARFFRQSLPNISTFTEEDKEGKASKKVFLLFHQTLLFSLFCLILGFQLPFFFQSAILDSGLSSLSTVSVAHMLRLVKLHLEENRKSRKSTEGKALLNNFSSFFFGHS
jgi:Na+/H+ antiporter NhaD/arsenite permease-like protein